MKSDKASQDIHSISQVSRLLFTLKAPMKTTLPEWRKGYEGTTQKSEATWQSEE